MVRNKGMYIIVMIQTFQELVGKYLGDDVVIQVCGGNLILKSQRWQECKNEKEYMRLARLEYGEGYLEGYEVADFELVCSDGKQYIRFYIKPEDKG